MVVDSACGKIILLGEHFVVHGSPAIAAIISNKAIVEIEKTKEIAYESNVHGTIPSMTTKAISYVLSAMKIKDKFKVKLTGDLRTVGGLGSSAAFCVALVKALAKEYKLKLTKEQINSYAYEGEKAFHGNPSGIDNTMATYGGVMQYTRGKTPQENKFEPVSCGTTLNIVVAITGIYGPTSVMIAKVKEFKDKNPQEFERLSIEMSTIISLAKVAIKEGELEAIGKLMNENQKLLSIVGVSSKENEKVISILKREGVLGAKITGGGGGGCCIGLAKDAKHAEKILEKLKKEGFDGFCTQVKGN